MATRWALLGLKVLALGLLAANRPAGAVEHTVVLNNFSFTPRTLTIQAGDSVRWRNEGGCHDVVADDSSFGSGAVSCANFEFVRRFDTAGRFGYYCSPHGSPGFGMAGSIVVEAASTPPAPALNRGSNGSWFNPQTNGQGFLVEIAPSGNIFTLAWFTWTADGGYDWYVGSGSFAGNVATVDLFRSRGGRFNDPAPVTSVDVGNATFTLLDCNQARFEFDIGDPVATGSIPLTRLLPPGPECGPPASGAAERGD